MAHDEKQTQKRNRLTYMILSVIIAIAAWALVAFANNPDIKKTFYSPDIVLKGGEQLRQKELIVINEPDLPDLSVKVTGKRRDLIDAIDKMQVEVDVSEISEPGTYNLKGNVIMPNSRINVEKVEFSSIPVHVDVYETRDFLVSVSQTGKIKNKIVRSIPESEIVRISGAKSELDLISYVFVGIDLLSLEASGEKMFESELINNEGDRIAKLNTVSNPSLKINNIIYDYKELPVKAELHEKLKGLYTIDNDATAITPSHVGVGVLPDSDTEELSVVIDEASENEREYQITEKEGLYIPDSSKTVKVKPVFSDMENTSENWNNTEE